MWIDDGIMAELEPILEQIRSLIVQHAPADMLKEALPFALICLVAGTALSVLGAKLARFALTCGFVLLGGAGGIFVARHTGYPQPLCGLAGALMLGVIGFQTFRLWVGVAAAIVLSAVALGAFGYKQVTPHYTEFHQMAAQADSSGESFALPTPQEQQAYLDRTPEQWMGEFRDFVSQRDANLEPKGRALGLAALVTGLCLGLLAIRTALILSTSLVGTSMVSVAIATVLTGSIEGSLNALEKHPILVGVGVGAFFFTSLIVQTLLTRKAPTEEPKAAAKA